MILAALLWFAPDAHAQAAFRLDPVMVPWIYADTPPLKDLASELRDDLERELAATYLIIPLSAVQRFEEYDARIYLDSCREDQRVECGYVIGARGSASWAVVGQLVAGSPGRPPEVLLSVVDIAQSREVLSFSSTVTLENHRAIADGLSLVLDQVISGDAGQLVDIRNGREMWELREHEREQRAETAREIEGTAEIDELARTIVPRAERDRMREEDLTRYDEREDDTPWAQLGFGPKEYVRFTNDGGTVEDWRALRKGRFGKLTISAWGGLGAGAYRHSYDGRYVIGVREGAFQTVGMTSQQVLRGASGSVFGLDVGIGVHPWVDAIVGVASRGAGYDALVYPETEGQPGTVPQEKSTIRATSEVRFGALVSPLPTFPVRPIGTAEVVLWSGARVDRVVGLPVDLPPLDRPTSVQLQIGPGVELPVGSVTLTSRMRLGIRVAGNSIETAESGDPSLLVQRPEEATAGGPVSFDWVFGASVPIGPLFGR